QHQPNLRDGRPIFQLLNDLNAREFDPLRELEPSDVVWHSGSWRSLSNRRLWALNHSSDGMSGRPLCVRARVRPVDAEFHAKSTSTNDGVSVMISARHPDFPELPVIDYDCIVVLIPMLCLGVTLGVLVNRTAPSWLLLLLLCSTLCLALWRTGAKGFKQLAK
ncbi:unnamed protein product, partial [Effrenium voratum]